MLVKLLIFFCSTHAVLATKAIYPFLYNALSEHSDVQGLEPNFQNEKFGSKDPVMPFIKTSSPTTCPANKILLQIESILTNILKNFVENSNGQKNVDDFQEIGAMLTKIQNRDLIKKNFAYTSTKTKSLRESFDINLLNRNPKPKISVQYELPNEADLSCKQALTEVLVILRNLNLMRDFPHSCGPFEDCSNKNILTKDEYGNNDIIPNIVFTSHEKNPTNSLMDSKLDWIKLVNYIASKQNDLHDGFATRENDTPFITRGTDVVGTFNKLPVVNPHSEPALDSKNFPINNSQYQLLVTEKILMPSGNHMPENFKDENLHFSEIIGNNVKHNTQAPFVGKTNPASDGDGLQDDVFIKGTSDGKIVSTYPTEDRLPKSSNNNQMNGNEPHNVNTNGPNTLFFDVISKDGNDRINPVLSMINSDDERMNLLSSLLQSNYQFKQLPQRPSIDTRYQYLTPYYINPIKENSIVSNQDTLYNKYYTYNTESNDHTLAKVNSLITISNQENTWPMSAHLTPHVDGNPYFVNSKLVDYSKYVNQLHASNNLEKFPRMDGVTNRLKLDAAPDNSGIVELTYLLRRPNPVVYQPIYFVKYRMPYDSFLNNVRGLLQSHPRLRTEPTKLYEKLLTATKIAEVSPSLKGVGQQKLLQMVAENGALVKTKVVKVNDTVLNNQLETLQNLNSNMMPKDLNNAAYSVRVKSEMKSDLLKNRFQDHLSDQLRLQKENIDKNNAN